MWSVDGEMFYGHVEERYELINPCASVDGEEIEMQDLKGNAVGYVRIVSDGESESELIEERSI